MAEYTDRIYWKSITGITCCSHSFDTVVYPLQLLELFNDPITMDITISPIMSHLSPNTVYDKNSLIRWYQTSNKDPITGIMSNNTLSFTPLTNLYIALLLLEISDDSLIFHKPNNSLVNLAILVSSIMNNKYDSDILFVDGSNYEQYTFYLPNVLLSDYSTGELINSTFSFSEYYTFSNNLSTNIFNSILPKQILCLLDKYNIKYNNIKLYDSFKKFKQNNNMQNLFAINVTSYTEYNMEQLYIAYTKFLSSINDEYVDTLSGIIKHDMSLIFDSTKNIEYIKYRKQIGIQNIIDIHCSYNITIDASFLQLNDMHFFGENMMCKNVEFIGTNFSNSNFIGLHFSNSNFIATKFDNTTFDNCVFIKCKIYKSSLGINFINCIFDDESKKYFDQ